MSTGDEEVTIIDGKRGDEFKEFITKLLKRGKLGKKNIKKLTDEEGMKMYSVIFTHSSADEENNYEFWELLGDKLANSCILKYFTRRFPQLRRPMGVNILSKLMIKYGSKKSFAEIGIEMGFFDFITASEHERRTKRNSLVEDAFEAFLGYTSDAIDNEVAEGAGYPICYNIVKSMFDDIKDISLKYRDLVDNITILKETFDKYRNDIGQKDRKRTMDSWIREEGAEVGTITIYTTKGRALASGTASLKNKAEQAASRKALEILEKDGYTKDLPKDFQYYEDLEE